MNKINVLYKNLQFNKMAFDADFNENYEFASELAINSLLKKASLANLKLKKSSSKEDLPVNKKVSKKNVSQTKKFTAHPKRFSEEVKDHNQNNQAKEEQVTPTLDESNRKIKLSRLQSADKKNEDASDDQDCETISEEISKIPRLVNFDKMKNQTILKPHKTHSNTTIHEMSCSEMKLVKPESDVDTGRESLYCSKINNMLIKIITQLNEIMETLKIGPNPIESIEDQIRREKKSIEFSARISRNYIYQLSRQIEDLRKNIRPSSSKSSCSNLSINQKFITSFQVVIQTLQAFYHFLPQAVYSRVIGKLFEMLHHVAEICKFTKHFRIANNLHGNIVLIEDVEYTVREIQFQTEQLACVIEEVSPKASKNDVRASKEPRVPAKKHALESRLSMYIPSVKKMQKGSQLWKKSAASLASKRFSVQSRYKPGIYHPKGVEKPVVHFPEKIQVGPKRSSELKNTPCQSLANEDEITTLVEMVTNDRPATAVISLMSAGKQSLGSNTSSNNNQQHLDQQEQTGNSDDTNDVQAKLQPLLQNLLTEISTAKNKDEFTNQSNDVLDKLKGLIEQVSSMKREDASAKKEATEQQVNSEQVQKNIQKEKSKENVSGARNAQLICIKDKSCYEDGSSATDKGSKDEVQVADKKSTVAIPADLPTNFTSLANETGGINNQINNNKQIVVKPLEKLKDKLPFGQLSKKVTINIVQYKLDFHKYTKSNHMYRKTPLIQPWILTSRISDKLLDHLLKAIITEIELNNIIERVYNSEFQ